MMKEQIIIFDTPIAKKHSIRYDTSDKTAAVSSVYIKRTAFGTEPVPEKVKVVITSVD